MDIKEFKPTIEELKSFVSSFKGLKVNGIDDDQGLAQVRKGRLQLKDLRVKITKTGKNMRKEALDFQKNVIAKEKEYIEIIEPIEKQLDAEEKRINELRQMESRKEELPSRKLILERKGWEMLDDETLLKMDNTEFRNYVYEEQERIEEEKRQEEARLREKELEERRRKDERIYNRGATRKAILAEYRKDTMYNQEDLGIMSEDLFEKVKEEAKKEYKYTLEKKAEAERAEKETEKLEKEKELNKKKEYQDFLEKIGYNEYEFYIVEKEDKRIFYKYVAEFNL